MLHLRDVLQLVIDGLNNSPLPREQPVGHRHKGALHVALEFGYQLYAVDEEPLEEFLADIPLVPDEFPIEELHKRPVLKRPSVVDIARREHEVKQLSLLVTDEVQLESEEPSHGALASPGNTTEGLVHMDALILADSQWCAVDEADARTLAQQYPLDEQSQRDGNLPLQLHEAVVGHLPWEKVAKMLADMFQIEMFQAAVAGVMEQNDDNHHLCLGECTVAMVASFSNPLEGIFSHHCGKKLAEFVCHKENFYNFVLGKHSGDCCERL